MKYRTLCCGWLFIQTCSLVSCARNPVIDKLDRVISARNTHVCLPLAIDVEKISFHGFDQRYPVETNIYFFFKKIIDESAEHVCAYMFDKTYFDQYANSTTLIADLVKYIRSQYPDISIFLNGLFTQTHESARALKLYFDRYNVDGIVVSPYQGDDVFQALTTFTDKVAIVQVKNGQPGAAVIENSVMAQGIPIWRFMLDLVISRWNTHNNLIPSFSFDQDEIDLPQLRVCLPDSMHCMLIDEDHTVAANNMRQLLGPLSTEVFVCPAPPTMYSCGTTQYSMNAHIIKKIIELKHLLNQQKKN